MPPVPSVSDVAAEDWLGLAGPDNGASGGCCSCGLLQKEKKKNTLKAKVPQTKNLFKLILHNLLYLSLDTCIFLFFPSTAGKRKIYKIRIENCYYKSEEPGVLSTSHWLLDVFLDPLNSSVPLTMKHFQDSCENHEARNLGSVFLFTVVFLSINTMYSEC